MGKYTPKQFSPRVYPEWGELLEDLSVEKQAEILNAIIKYPNENPSGGVWKFIKSQIDKDYEEFVERNKAHQTSIKNYWNNKREQMITNDNKCSPLLNKSEQRETYNININEEHKQEYNNISSDKSSDMFVKNNDFDVQKINDVLEKHNLAKIKKLTNERKTKLKQRCNDVDGFDNFLKEVDLALTESSFLRGDNKNGWKADFDFFLQKSSWQKAIEGGYRDNKPPELSKEQQYRESEERLKLINQMLGADDEEL